MAFSCTTDDEVRNALSAVLLRYPTFPCHLKEKQVDAIASVLRNRDTFAILPTGYGKSLIYYLLPMAYDFLFPKDKEHKALVLIVSPLTQLTSDQIKKLASFGINGLFLTSAQQTTSPPEVSHVFSSPETILTSGWRVASGSQTLPSTSGACARESLGGLPYMSQYV